MGSHQGSCYEAANTTGARAACQGQEDVSAVARAGIYSSAMQRGYDQPYARDCLSHYKHWRLARTRTGSVGKRDALREVSFLGQTYEIDLATMDLSQLMGGRDFTIPCRISRNGYSIALKALVDTGANGLLFINTPCAMEAIRFFNTTVVPLKKQCPVLGFDGKAGRPITQVIILHFLVDGRRQLNVPMLIADLGQHNLIVGRKWLEKHDVWLDSANRCLI